jgi:hypothetical protein
VPNTLRNILGQIQQELTKSDADLNREHAMQVVDMVLRSYPDAAVHVRIISTPEEIALGQIALEAWREDVILPLVIDRNLG